MVREVLMLGLLENAVKYTHWMVLSAAVMTAVLFYIEYI